MQGQLDTTVPTTWSPTTGPTHRTERGTYAGLNASRGPGLAGATFHPRQPGHWGPLGPRPTGATALQAPPLTEGPIPTTGPAPRHEPCPAGPSPQAPPHPQGAINTFSCSRRCSSQALSTSAGCDSPRVHRAPHTCSCTRGSLSVMASSRMVDSPTVTKSDGRVRPGPGPPPGSASEDSASLAWPLQPQAHTQPLLSTVPAGVCGTHWPPTLRSLWPPLPQPSNPGRVFSASPAQLDPSSYKKQAVWAQPHEAAPGGPLAHTLPWTMLWQRAGPGCRYSGQSE